MLRSGYKLPMLGGCIGHAVVPCILLRETARNLQLKDSLIVHACLLAVGIVCAVCCRIDVLEKAGWASRTPARARTLSPGDGF